MYIYKKCYMGFCTLRCTVMDFKKKTKKVVSYDMEFYLITIFRKASRLVKWGL